MMKTKTTQSKFMKIVTMPIKALAKARDFYVRSMNNYADRACYGATAGYADPLPRSFSSNSAQSNGNDDFRELVRAASTSTLGNRINMNTVDVSNNATNGSNVRSKGNRDHLSGIKGVPRSASVGMAKIEEDKPIEFNDSDYVNKNVGKNNNGGNIKHKFGIFPRSRSYAVGATKRNSAVF
ncbi:hypothetical protein BVRB_1g014830 [Beta vulgaris subsp. vulgaris]|nr:hypothetical protein BVRB_1g014830 [Beta vulgaris subsp. vulgaris]